MINGYYYGYDSSSYRESVGLQNEGVNGVGAKNFSVLGKSKEVFTITLSLDNTYVIHMGEVTTGNTTWLGVSRLHTLKTTLGAMGASMPIVFVSPYGATYRVVPTGTIDIGIFNETNPDPDGVEFRVSLTLESL